MSELARELIAECQRTKSTYLDLGRCGLTDLNEIPELFECVHLEVLVLSNAWWDREKGEWQNSQNKSTRNNIKVLSPKLSTLSNLNTLICGGQFDNPWQITDITCLKELKNLTNLNLSKNYIIDITCLKELKNLTNLSLNINQITDISALKELQSLTSLDLRRNQITDISALKELKNLTELTLNENQITDISALKELKNLTELFLGYNNYTDISNLKELNLTELFLGYNDYTDISNLKELKNLTKLELMGTQISDISWLIELKNLTELFLGNNNIADISSLKELWNLTELDLSENKITDISSLKELWNLASLDLSENKITDISSLKELWNLVSLNLSENNITDISSLKELWSLTELDLGWNNISVFPQFLLTFSSEIVIDVDFAIDYNKACFNLNYNPIQDVPIEIIQQGKEAIRRYLDEERGTPLNEAKLLILGEGNAGKTTMVEKLLDPHYTLIALSTTHGIVVRQWHFAPYTAHIWDFGGQAIYHATHRFFLTQRSLYVLLTDNRAEDTDFNYWFEKIALFGGDSPLIIVQNERDNRKKELSATITGATLNNLKQVVQVNFADNRGLPELIQALKTQFCGLAHINQPFPKRWRKVREALEGLDENHISWDMYSRLCKDNGIPEKEVQSDLCRYLHDLGILLHFEDSPLLKKTVFLQPDWVTGAVYHLLDFIGKGLFTEAEAAAVWSAPENKGQYDDMQTELLALISKFEICYTRDQIYILPQLLSEKAPAYNWYSADNLQVIYRYGFMPQGILWRLMVRLNRYLPDTNLVWKKGAIFTREESKAEITEENTYLKREIRIRVSGKFKKEFLTILLEELENIHRSYHFEKIPEDNRPKMLVPCNCRECRDSIDPIFYEYSDLRRRLTKGKDTIECRMSYELCNVRSLLEDVFIYQKELEYLGKWEEGSYELRMLRMGKMNYLKNKDQLFDQIDNNELDAVFETIRKNKGFFQGFNDLEQRFIYDGLKGTDLQNFKQALKTFVNSKLEKD